MDEGELSMEQAKELTAKYICDNEEWLKIALHVYKTKETVRWHLIEQIWQGVKERIDKIDGIEGCADKNGYRFWHKDAANFRLYGEVEQGNGMVLYLIVGIYVADKEALDVERREEIRQCYDPTASKQKDPKDPYIVKRYVGPSNEQGRWDWDKFLEDAVMRRDKIESYLEDLLLTIYHRVEGDLKRIAKDVWG